MPMKAIYDKFDVFRNCPNPRKNPKCRLLIRYGSNKEKRRCEKRNAVCVSCRGYGKTISVDHRQKVAEIQRLRMSGPTNPMKNRIISQEEHERRSKAQIGINTGKNNPMYGRSGEKSPNWGRKHSEESKRIKSEKMRGRIPPRPNTPLGISGIYKGKHFRSSCELRFLMGQTVEWQSAEIPSLKIPYVDESGKSRFHYPDWYVPGIIVEIKPRGWKTWKPTKYSRSCVPKIQAAEQYCKTIGWEYRLVEMLAIESSAVFRMRRNNEVSLDPHWEKKYQKWEVQNS